MRHFLHIMAIKCILRKTEHDIFKTSCGFFDLTDADIFLRVIILFGDVVLSRTCNSLPCVINGFSQSYLFVIFSRLLTGCCVKEETLC